MLLVFVLLLGLILWVAARNPLDQPKVKAKIYDINKQWGEFIAGYRQLARNDDERAVTDRMLNDLRAQGMPVPDTSSVTQAMPLTAPTEVSQPITTQGWQLPGEPVVAQQTVTTPLTAPVAREPMDNTSILLYFGAFLLVAAAGLFVAFGGATGGVRTFIIAVVAALFYCMGFWLWYDRPKLRQAALTFIAVGIICTPLAGVAAYNYVFSESGPLVWFATSIICLGLYAHAVYVLKHPLLQYVLIGAFVSLFESSIAVLTLPIYYYAWGLAAAGLVIQSVQIWRKRAVVGDSPSALSSHILIPLSLFVSLNMVAQHGAFQLGVALLLSALYYGVVAMQSMAQARLSALTAAQALFLAAAVSFGYSFGQDFVLSAVVLMCLALPQVAWLWLRPTSELSVRIGTVMLFSLATAVLLAQHDSGTTLAAFIVLAVVAGFIWLRHARVGSYVVALIASIGALLTGVYGVAHVADQGLAAAVLAAALVWLQLVIFYSLRKRPLDTPQWRMWFQAMMVASALVGLVAVIAGNGNMVSTPFLLLTYAVFIAVSWTPLIVHEDSSLWTTLVGVLPFVPLLCLMTQAGSFDRPGLCAATAVGVIIWNSALSAWRKTEQTRAFATVAALMTPLCISSFITPSSNAIFYAGTYTFVMALLLFARFAALYQTNSSTKDGLSYAVGSAVAAVLVLTIVPFAHDRLLSATTAFSVALLVVVAARFVEKLPVLMAVLPFVVQIGLWSTYRDGQLVAYAALSALIAALGYYTYVTSVRQVPHSAGYYVHYASLVTAYIPVMVYFAATSNGKLVWTLPWAVFLATITTLHSVWGERQSVREWTAGFVTGAILLILHYYGVRNIQLYAHVFAALFAAFAYWRYRRKEQATSDSYITATLVVATIPLVIQAIGGTAGDLYGWWLLIEQVVIMLLGMLLKKRLMIRWGLYVALAAVIYQLRHLGWAAVAVLALFLIGLGIVRLQRTDHQDSSQEPPAS